MNDNDTITLPRNVVEQALEALREAQVLMDHFQDEKLRRSAMEALRAALEQPQVEQEPIAWANINKQGDITHTSNKKTAWAKTPLYTHPQPQPQPKREPLCEDEGCPHHGKTHVCIN